MGIFEKVENMWEIDVSNPGDSWNRKTQKLILIIVS